MLTLLTCVVFYSIHIKSFLVLIKFIIEFVNQHGIYVHSFRLAAEDYGSPTVRDRQYLLLFPIEETTPINQLADEYNTPYWSTEFTDALERMQIGAGDPDCYILPEENPFKTAWRTAARAAMLQKDHNIIEAAVLKSKKRGVTGEPKDEDWHSIHLETYRRTGLKWPPTVSDDTAFGKSVQHLPRRAKECAYFFTYCHTAPWLYLSLGE